MLKKLNVREVHYPAHYIITVHSSIIKVVCMSYHPVILKKWLFMYYRADKKMTQWGAATSNVTYEVKWALFGKWRHSDVVWMEPTKTPIKSTR